MELLRLLAWLLVLVVVVGLAFSLMPSWENWPVSSPWSGFITAPGLRKAQACPVSDTSINPEPWDLYNSRWFNLSYVLELLSSYMDPVEYYRLYASLTGLAAVKLVFNCTGYSVYELHPLPKSEGDYEGLAKLNITLCMPHYYLIPPVEARLTSNRTFEETVVSIHNPCTNTSEEAVVPLNILTYAPTARLNISTRMESVYNLTVWGYANGSVDYSLESQVVDESCGYDPGLNKTVCNVTIYSKYIINVNYTLGIVVGNEAVLEEYTGSTVFTARSSGSYRELCIEDGYYNGTGPYARACTNLVVESNNTRMENSTHVVYTTEYYIAEATVATWTRGLRIPSMVEASVYLDGFQVLTGFLDTVRLIAGSRVFSVNESGLVEKLVFSNLTETRLYNITVYISDYIGFTSGIKSPSSEKPFGGVVFNRTLRMAEITVKAKPVEPGDWDWESVRDLGVNVYASIQYHYPDPSTINPVEVKKAITPNPAESILQYLALAYIHDKLVSIVESSPMSEYRDAYLWLLAAQIPIAMKNCSRHESPKPLLDALCQACGSDHERVWILGNITGFTLEVVTATGLVKWPSLTDETIVETPIVYANITGYPALWQLYNETLKTHLAHPVGGKYLVYYNPVENTVFCDWDRLVGGVELPTPTQPPEETPPEMPPMPV
jgi:hypothetical protein